MGKWLLKQRKRGVTMIELSVVLAIILVVVVLATLSMRQFGKEGALEAGAQDIVKTLRLAQNKTLASEGASVFGVQFATSSFTLFNGPVFNPGDPANERHILGSLLSISQINLASSSGSAVFKRVGGNTDNFGTIRIEMSDDAAEFKILTIEQSGAISISTSTVSDASRVVDSRHVHLYYSQNTKTASTLSLYFPDDNYTFNVDYQAHLNDDKSEFFWEGTVAVGGQNQSLKIHSHSLSDLATDFSIHRDRRYNSKPLEISLDGQNIIKYSSGGIVTKGTSLWVGEPQIQ